MSLRTDVKNAAKGSIHGSIAAFIGGIVTFVMITLFESWKRWK